MGWVPAAVSDRPLRKSVFKTRYGVINLGIFGSVARDEAVEVSDVDVVVEMQAPDLFFMVHILS